MVFRQLERGPLTASTEQSVMEPLSMTVQLMFIYNKVKL
jgi:hypothetical protein